MSENYQHLHNHFHKLSQLEHMQSVLVWDWKVMMPEGGTPARIEALTALADMHHTHLTDPRIGGWIEQAKNEALDAWQQANLREMDRSYTIQSAIPQSLASASAKASAEGEHAWATHRPDNNWQAFQPYLENVVKLARERAAIIGEALNLDIYDACLEQYQPGLKNDAVTQLLGDLKDFLPSFMQQAISARPTRRPLPGPFNTHKQLELGRSLAAILGFDFSHGRLDTSAHPFTIGSGGDTRITTRCKPDDFIESYSAVIHEAGHALYDQNLPKTWKSQPVGSALGMAMHESQSLFMEMQIGNSRAFLNHATSEIKRHLAQNNEGDAWSSENLYHHLIQVRPGKIRVEADEVSYPLHIIMRWEIEQALMTGKLDVKQIPERWDAGMQTFFNINTHGDFANGPMQDPHWASGNFGYFPCYTCGALIAAQLMAALRNEQPDIDTHIANGNLAPATTWLNEKIWSRGCYDDLATLIKNATNKPLSTDAFKQHLHNLSLIHI